MAEERSHEQEHRQQRLPVRREERGITPFEEAFTSPFSLMRRIREDIDRMFSDFGMGTMITPFLEMRAMTPAVDVWETDDEIKVRADLPGVDPNQIEIETTEDSLRISAETSKEEERREKGYYRAERHFGRFERMIDLPVEIKPEHAKANFRRGVLEITLPKTEHAKEKMKKIPVEVEEEEMAGIKGGETSREQKGRKKSK